MEGGFGRLFRGRLPSDLDDLHNRKMTELLERAVATARALSPNVQDQIARMVLAFAGERTAYDFSAGEAADLDEAEAAADRGDFASEDEVKAIWAKHGL